MCVCVCVCACVCVSVCVIIIHMSIFKIYKFMKRLDRASTLGPRIFIMFTICK